MWPFNICNSYAVKARYRKFLAGIRDECDLDTDESETRHLEDVLDEFHAWLIDVFQPIFLEAAPGTCIPPSNLTPRTGE
jgi:hypothetical protein